MKNKIMQNKKKTIMIFIITLLTIILLSFKFFFVKTVETILNISLKPTFNIGKIYIEPPIDKKGKILIKDVVIEYKKETLIHAPVVEIDYNLNNSFTAWLELIKVSGSKVLIELSKGKANIVDAFTSGGSDPLFISTKIEVTNASAVYKDISYKTKIEEKIENVNGYVNFSIEKGIDLKIAGEKNKNLIEYTYNEHNKKYNMTIKTQNLEVKTSLLQYAYYLKGLEYKKGLANIDLKISEKGLFGKIDFKDLAIEYEPYKAEFTNGKGIVNFKGHLINLKSEIEVFGKKREFLLMYDAKKGLKLNMNIGNLTYSEMEKYEKLKKLNLKLKNLNFKGTNIEIRVDEKDNFYLDASSNVEEKNKKNKLLGLEKIELKMKNDDIKIKLKDVWVLGNRISKNPTLNFKIQDTKMDIEYEIGKLKGNIELIDKKDKILLESKEGLVKLKGVYDLKTKVLLLNNLDLKESKEDKFLFEYDFINKKLLKYDGELKFNISEEYSGVLKADKDGEIFKILEFEILDKNKKKILNADGELNLKNFLYELNFQVNDFKYLTKIQEKKTEILSSFNGVVGNKNKKQTLDLEGTIKHIKVEETLIEGLRMSIRVRDNIVEILDLSNSFFKGKGKYFINKNKLMSEYKIFDLSNENIKIKELKYKIIEANGEIEGTVKNLNGKLRIKKMLVQSFGEKEIVIKGQVVIQKNKIKLEKIILDETSEINGEYNYKNKSYTMKGKILNKEIFKYLKFEEMVGTLEADISVKGKGKDIKINAQVAANKLYYKRYELPEFRGVITYEAKKLFDGVVLIKEIDVLKNNFRIGEVFGNINLKEDSLNLHIKSNVDEVGKYFKENLISGTGKINGIIKGTIKNPHYEIETKNTKIKYKNISFEGINFRSSGTKDKINIEELKFEYLKNIFFASGWYDLKKDAYNFKMKSKEINLNFLNIFFEEYTDSKINGKAEFDIVLDSKGNKGNFIGSEISFDNKKYFINGKNLTFDFLLNGKTISINKFIGLINDGETSIKGVIEIPSFKNIVEKTVDFREIKRDLILKIKKASYNIPNYLNIVFDADLTVKNKEMSGDIIFQGGEITNVPNVGSDLSIIKTIKDIILSPFNKKIKKREFKGIVEEKKIKTSKFSTNIGVKIEKGIELDIESIAAVVQGVTGTLRGSGRIEGTDKEITYLGNLEIGNGEFFMGDNDFYIRSARVIFSNPNDYYPDFNPRLLFEANTRDFNNNIEIGVAGEMNDLKFRIKTKNENSSGSISSLFIKETKDGETGVNSEVSSIFFKSIIDSQISGVLLGPTARKLKKIFGLSKLRISSDFIIPSTTDDERENNNFAFGAKLEIEDKIYKDKLFIVGRARFLGSETENGKNKGNTFDKYSAGLLYKISENKSIGIGVETYDKESIKNLNDEKKENSLNYYIDFRLEKKYDSLSEIFFNPFQKNKN